MSITGAIKNQDNIKRVEIKVTGRVQGVFFRQGVKAKADELGFVGFVRNEPDGSVFIVAEGGEESLQKLIEWAKVGIGVAQVDKVSILWVKPGYKFNDFKIQE